jgi:hypothetical protein
MDILSPGEIDGIVNKSKLRSKYDKMIDSKSAYEILNAKLDEAAERTQEVQEKVSERKSKRSEKSMAEEILESPVTRQIGRTAAAVITRSLLGALGLGGRSRKRSIF